MKSISKICLSALMITATLVPTATVLAGNPDRTGQAGATELLINPWARCSGWGGANSASVHGLEALYLNVGGTAFTKRQNDLRPYQLVVRKRYQYQLFWIDSKSGINRCIGNWYHVDGFW